MTEPASTIRIGELCGPVERPMTSPAASSPPAKATPALEKNGRLTPKAATAVRAK